MCAARAGDCTTEVEARWQRRQSRQSSSCRCRPGKATPAPPVGPALGPHGVQAAQFCQQFNERTRKQEEGVLIPVVITIYTDKSFTFITKTPPAAVLIKKALGLEKGSGEPNKTKVGALTRDKLRAIAEQKMPDLTAKDIEAAMKIIAGTARSMGVTVEG